MRTLPDCCIPLTLTSPPYDDLYEYGGHGFDFEGIAAELFRITMIGGVAVWVVQEQIVDGSETGTSSRQRTFFQDLGFRLHHTMIMQPYSYRTHSQIRYGNSLQYAQILSKGQPRSHNLIRDRLIKEPGRTRPFHARTKDGRLYCQKQFTPKAVGVRGPIWFYATGRHIAEEDYTVIHPARMAESIACRHIRTWSRRGDLVFDPLAGVGTTCKMALLLGRRYLGMEIHEPYWEVAVRRVEEAKKRLENRTSNA
jgi:site-specific DNA-methyltransferase (adenine-specific)